jgi:hypothetical protein
VQGWGHAAARQPTRSSAAAQYMAFSSSNLPLQCTERQQCCFKHLENSQQLL